MFNVVQHCPELSNGSMGITKQLVTERAPRCTGIMVLSLVLVVGALSPHTQTLSSCARISRKYQDLDWTGPRPGSYIHSSSGFKNDGNLSKVQVTSGDR